MADAPVLYCNGEGWQCTGKGAAKNCWHSRCCETSTPSFGVRRSCEPCNVTAHQSGCPSDSHCHSEHGVCQARSLRDTETLSATIARCWDYARKRSQLPVAYRSATLRASLWRLLATTSGLGTPPPRMHALRWGQPQTDRYLYTAHQVDRCAVVGSSGTLGCHEYGADIEGHTLVLRANAAPAGGRYARSVGNRTDLAFLRWGSDQSRWHAMQLCGPHQSRTSLPKVAKLGGSP